MSLLPYRDEVTATNTISNATDDFEFIPDALQKDFVIIEPGRYVIGIGYSWAHEKKDQEHRVRVRVDGVVLPFLQINQPAGLDLASTVRLGTERAALFEFPTADTYDIDFQLATGNPGEPAYLYERALLVARYD